MMSNLLVNRDAYKAGTYRIHYKGHRDPVTRKTPGIPLQLHPNTPSPTLQGQPLQKLRILSPRLYSQASSSPLIPAVRSHHLAWHAIVRGLEAVLQDAPDLAGHLRAKITAYVYDTTAPASLQGTLKAARYKVYVNDRKCFDYVSLATDDLDEADALALRRKVKAAVVS